MTPEGVGGLPKVRVARGPGYLHTTLNRCFFYSIQLPALILQNPWLVGVGAHMEAEIRGLF